MREDLKKELYKSAVRRAGSNSYSFSTFTKDELTKFINEGVDKMSYTDYVSDASRQLAEDNLLSLIDAMNNDGKKRQREDTLDYTSFTNARMSVCPLWPFC